MWRWRLTERNWVRTWTRFSPLLMQLLIGMSIRRYLPATGTAGLLRSWVGGYSRVPRPPPRMRLRTLCMESLAGTDPVGEAEGPTHSRPLGSCYHKGHYAANRHFRQKSR